MYSDAVYCTCNDQSILVHRRFHSNTVMMGLQIHIISAEEIRSLQIFSQVARNKSRPYSRLLNLERLLILTTLSLKPGGVTECWQRNR